ncbi:MAG: hypothetical protein ABJD07_03915 [Gemmatimonadaceae bacterium]
MRFDARDRFRRAALALVALVAALGYANALGNGFVLDDKGIISSNALVHHGDGLWRAFVSPYWPNGAGQYRPLAIASFALDWIATGGSAHWMHAVNVLWHVLASVLVVCVAAEFLAPAAALVAGLVFALHPVHVEAVSNLVGRSECMATSFVLLALLAHRRGSSLAPLAFAAALLSKESAIVFLALAPASDLLLSEKPRETVRERRWLYAAYGVATLAYAGVLLAVFRGRALMVPAASFHGVATGERLLTVLSIIPEYARLLLVPARLSADYEPAVLTIQRSVTAPVVAGIGLLVLYALVLARSWRHAPALAFALLVVPLGIAPVSNVLYASGVLLAERTLYLPSVGVALALAWCFERATSGAPVRATRLALAASAIVLAAFALRAWTRTRVWHDPRTFAYTALEEHPEAYRAHVVAGRVLAAMQNLPAADDEYRKARTIFSRDGTVYQEASDVALARGDYRRGSALLDTAIALMPANTSYLLLRSRLRLALGDTARAAADAAVAARLAGAARDAAALSRALGAERASAGAAP